MRELNTIERREKEVRALKKERDKLYRALRELGYVSLEKPLRYGWYKHLVLRDDIARRKDAAIFQEILDVCGNDVWGRDKKQVEKSWDRENRINKYLQFPGFKMIEKIEFNKLSVKAKQWFDGYDWHWSVGYGFVKRYHCQVPGYYFKITYTKAFITKKRVVNPRIEKRIEEINEKLSTNEYYKYAINHYKWISSFYHKRERQKAKLMIDQMEIV